MDELLDDVYERMRGTGPEFQGWLSNHGPMAADALLRMGRRDMVGAWLEDYASRLEDEPRPRWPIKEAEWQDVIGDSSRLADWCALFTRQVHEEAWPELLARWWPRLLPGAIAAAAHGLIRTGHAVRALQEDVTPQRLDELAQGLGYWAARWQRLPLEPRPAGSADTLAALSAVPTIAGPGGVRARLKELERTPEWPPAVTSLRPVTNPDDVPGALEGLVDAAVTRYHDWAHGNPIMLVHAATGPRAATLVLPSLPQHLWVSTHDVLWAVTAALGTAYRPREDPPPDISGRSGCLLAGGCDRPGSRDRRTRHQVHRDGA